MTARQQYFKSAYEDAAALGRGCNLHAIRVSEPCLYAWCLRLHFCIMTSEADSLAVSCSHETANKAHLTEAEERSLVLLYDHSSSNTRSVLLYLQD